MSDQNRTQQRSKRITQWCSYINKNKTAKEKYGEFKKRGKQRNE